MHNRESKLSLTMEIDYDRVSQWTLCFLRKFCAFPQLHHDGPQHREKMAAFPRWTQRPDSYITNAKGLAEDDGSAHVRRGPSSAGGEGQLIGQT